MQRTMLKPGARNEILTIDRAVATRFTAPTCA